MDVGLGLELLLTLFPFTGTTESVRTMGVTETVTSGMNYSITGPLRTPLLSVAGE